MMKFVAKDEYWIELDVSEEMLGMQPFPSVRNAVYIMYPVELHRTFSVGAASEVAQSLPESLSSYELRNQLWRML